MAGAQADIPPDTGDVDILGDDTHSIIVRADQHQTRGWFRNAPICQLLGQHHIAHVGIMQARSPFEIIRRDPGGTFMLACYHGEGVILADGGWKKIRAGQACLLPPFVMNSLKCIPGHPWRFAWVRYQESRETRPIVSSISPVAGPCDPEPLRASITGLHSECVGPNAPSAVHHWSELIHHYVMRFAQPHRSDDRLWRVWQRVDAELAQPWTLSKLASIACMSEEHLRRVCRKELGRSPMQHLTFLRLQRARHLLSVTDDKVEVIAKAVGFESIGTFSNTFTKWIGWRPSEHRRAVSAGKDPA